MRRLAGVGLILVLLACGDDGTSGSECASGTFAGDSDCVPWTECVPGERVSAEGTATADRACQPCTAETFSAATNAAACTAWTSCVPGEHVSAEGTAFADRSCEACGTATFSTEANASACMAWTSCAPGEHVSQEGTATTDRACEPCTAETFSTAENVAACTAWTSCVPGQYVAVAGTATADRSCAPCASGSFSTQSNTALCTTWTTCMPGQYVAGKGSATADRSCAPCAAASYSALPNAASCTAWTTCVPGQYVAVAGTATTDRSCAPCAAGSFSTQPNTASCTAWTVCAVGDEQETPGTATSDRTCRAMEWTRQFGSTSSEQVLAASVGANGRIAVAGMTGGTMPGQTQIGGNDAFVRVFDAGGNVLWTRQFGTSHPDSATGVAVGADGRVVVVGHTSPTSITPPYAFVRTYDASGTPLWSREIATEGTDFAFAVAVSSDGRIVVAGSTDNTLPGESSAGISDAFVRLYDANGNVLWTDQFGSSGFDAALGVAFDDSFDRIVVAGATTGTLPGQTSAGNRDSFVRSYQATGTLQWTRQFGTAAEDSANAVDVGAGGHVVVAGYTDGTYPGQTSAGSRDALIRAYDVGGTLQATYQFGTAGVDVLNAVAHDTSLHVIVAGYTTGTFIGQTSAGGTDAFVQDYNVGGNLLFTRQLGSSGSDIANAVARDPGGNLVVAGNTTGTLPGQTHVGSNDAFVQRIRR